MSPPADPTLLPVVLAYSRFEDTTALCLDSLLGQASDMQTKVYVFDNGSPDNSAALLANYSLNSRHSESLHLSFHPTNLGFAGGMNKAVAVALRDWEHSSAVQPDWIVLINSDTLFPNDALRALSSSLLRAPPSVGLVGPLTNTAGNAQNIELDFQRSPLIQKDFESWSFAAQILMQSPAGLNWPIQRADFFCVAIRKTVWQQLNGLDLSYGRGYFEDFDFSVRAAAAGFQSVLTEDCLIYHQGSATFKTNPQQKKLIRQNKAILLKKFPHLALPHKRMDNLAVMCAQLEYMNSASSISSSAEQLLALRLRSDLRWLAAQNDKPKSPLKRWLWSRRLAALEKNFCL